MICCPRNSYPEFVKLICCPRNSVPGIRPGIPPVPGIPPELPSRNCRNCAELSRNCREARRRSNLLRVWTRLLRCARNDTWVFWIVSLRFRRRQRLWRTSAMIRGRNEYYIMPRPRPPPPPPPIPRPPPPPMPRPPPLTPRPPPPPPTPAFSATVASVTS